MRPLAPCPVSPCPVSPPLSRKGPDQIRWKSSNGVIRDNVLSLADIEVTPLQHYLEGAAALRNVTITGNHFTHQTPFNFCNGTNRMAHFYPGTCQNMVAYNNTFDTPPTPPPSPPPPPPLPLPGYTTHPNANCFPGHGGVAVPGPDPVATGVGLNECAVSCAHSSECTAIVRRVPAREGACFLRYNITLGECNAGNYVTYTKL